MSLRASRKISTDEFRIVSGDGSQVLLVMTRAEAERVANDLIELGTVAPAVPEGRAAQETPCEKDSESVGVADSANSATTNGVSGSVESVSTTSRSSASPRSATPQLQRQELVAALIARRKHQGEIIEAAHKLYKRQVKPGDDPEIMDLWSLAVVDPEPLTERDIQRTRELFPELFSPRSATQPPAPDIEAIPDLDEAKFHLRIARRHLSELQDAAIKAIEEWTLDTPESYAQRDEAERFSYRIWIAVKQLVERLRALVPSAAPQERTTGERRDDLRVIHSSEIADDPAAFQGDYVPLEDHIAALRASSSAAPQQTEK